MAESSRKASRGNIRPVVAERPVVANKITKKNSIRPVVAAAKKKRVK